MALPWEKNVVGLAIRVTPTNDTSAPICSMRVKGSRKSIAQAKQESVGEMNVITVASARGRKSKESVQYLVSVRRTALALTTLPKDTYSTCQKRQRSLLHLEAPITTVLRAGQKENAVLQTTTYTSNTMLL